MKISRSLLSLVVLFSLSMTCSPQSALGAPPEGVQSGELRFEEEEETTPLKKAQEDARTYFTELEKRLPSLAASPGRVEPPNESAITYLTGVYLYCTISSGTCPIPLQALLEVDIINSRVDKASSCPTSTTFWRLWLKNGMEDRQQHLVKTGNLGATSDFTARVRPSFIKCQDTVAREIGGDNSASDFFKARYGDGSTPQAQYVSKLRGLLDLLYERKVDVFAETGALSAPKKGKDAATTTKGEKKK